MKKWFYPLALVTLVGFGLMFLMVSKGEIITIDEVMTKLFGDNAFITFFHFFGETKFIVIMTIILIGYLWVRKRNFRGMLFVVFSVGVGNVLNQLIKKWVQRERPDVPHQLDSFSFPSGHAMVGLLYLFTIAYFLTENQSSRLRQSIIWLGAILVTILVGFSRIAEHRHFASDVFSGWMVGYTWFVIVALWYEYRKRVFKKHTP